jgi:hypothetical protein
MKNILVTTLILLCPSLALAGAGAGLPELSGQTNVGRVILFKSLAGVSWFSPTAFSSKLSCTGKTCIVRVFNALSPDEAAKMDALGTGSDALNITYFSDIDSGIVSNISEQVTGLPNYVETNSMMLKTMRLSDNSPYATIALRGDAFARVAQDYANAGVGTFELRFNLRGQKTNAFLSIRDGQCLKTLLLAKKDGGMYYRKVRDLANQAIINCGLRSMGYDPIDASDTAVFHITEELFTYQGLFSGYVVNEKAVNEIGQSYVIYNLADSPQTLSCVAQLVLKDGATPSVECK